MKALSVKQPHAEEIAKGKKLIEYRSWGVKYRGPLLIVASKMPDLDSCKGMNIDPAKLTHGATICVVDLVNVTGEYDDYEWHLSNPRRVLATPVRGYAALYTVPDTAIKYVVKAA